jgi:hypothetical protein
MENCGRSSLLVLMLMAILGSAILVFNLSPVMATPAIDPVAAPSPLPVGAGLPAAAETFRKLPLSFIENQGQVDQRVKYYAKIPQSSVYFTSRDLVLSFPRQAGIEGPERSPKNRQGAVLRLVPEGMNPKARLLGAERQEHRVNYFIGNDPGRWRTGLPTFRVVTYRDAYAGIDLQFYGTGRTLEYDIIVKPGGNPDQVRFRCLGARSLELTPEGDLAIKLAGGGSLVQKKPLIYQEINGVRVKTEGRFSILGDTNQCRYGFQVASYDRQHPLIIDPVLAFSTFLGGAGEDRGQGIAVDSAGNILVAGFTNSSDFPICFSGSHLRPYVADYDAFVTKIKADFSGVVYSTFLGGNSSDQAYAVAVDASGNAYVTGFTGSDNFPTAPLAGPLYPYRGNGDAFVAKISPDGAALVFSTYLGSSNADYGRGIAVDGQNNVYVTGYTLSSGFPTMPSDSPLRPFGGGTDAFVTKINADATALVYSTFLGGGGYDRGNAIVVDTAGNAYITGETRSENFPTWPDGAPLLPFGGGTSDAFVTKINANATALVFSTYLGGGNADIGYGIAVDGSNNVFVTGETASNNFPVVPVGAPLRPYGGGIDAFVTKIKFDGSQLLFSSFLGGGSSDTGYAMAVDRFGDVYVAGETNSSTFPTWPSGRPLFPKSGGIDAFVTKIKGNGSALLYSTFIGGTYTDRAYGIAVDQRGSAYITGITNSDGDGTSTSFPQKLPLQGYGGGSSDAFVAKIIDPHDLSWLLLLLD